MANNNDYRKGEIMLEIDYYESIRTAIDVIRKKLLDIEAHLAKLEEKHKEDD